MNTNPLSQLDQFLNFLKQGPVDTGALAKQVQDSLEEHAQAVQPALKEYQEETDHLARDVLVKSNAFLQRVQGLAKIQTELKQQAHALGTSQEALETAAKAAKKQLEEIDVHSS